MPKLNLRDDEFAEEPGQFDSEAPVNMPTLRDVGGEGSGRGASVLVQIFIIVVLLGGITFALNHFNVIHLWGKKPAQVVEQLPMPDAGADQTQSPAQTTPEEKIPDQVPTPSVTPPQQTQAKTPVHEPPSQAVVESPKATPPAMGSGSFTVQVSAWLSKSKADNEATLLRDAGYQAYVDSKTVAGETWFRVRVGRYTTKNEAGEKSSQLQRMLEGRVFVTKADI